MTRYTLHVPEKYNDGTAVGQEVFAEIERSILDRAGGFTLTHGIGAYSGAFAEYHEPVRLYAVDGGSELAMRVLAEKIAVALDQEAVYLTRAIVHADLIYAPTRKREAVRP